MSDSDGAVAPPRAPSESERRIRAATIGEPQRLDGSIELLPYDTAWPTHYGVEGCFEIDRMLSFRDHLRSSPDDRDLYARTKRELGARRWSYVQEYADAKTAVVDTIIARAMQQ
jgi:GrpB-like predicted nucleotidyltransferase (UPF0157 family)